MGADYSEGAAYIAGFRAGREGRGIADIPFQPGTVLGAEWTRGYARGHREEFDGQMKRDTEAMRAEANAAFRAAGYGQLDPTQEVWHASTHKAASQRPRTAEDILQAEEDDAVERENAERVARGDHSWNAAPLAAYQEVRVTGQTLAGLCEGALKDLDRDLIRQIRDEIALGREVRVAIPSPFVAPEEDLTPLVERLRTDGREAAAKGIERMRRDAKASRDALKKREKKNRR